MYSLPITTYTDYLRMTRLWGTYLGGTVAIIAGTSLAGPLSKWQTVSMSRIPVSYTGNIETVVPVQPSIPLELPKVQTSTLGGEGTGSPTKTTRMTVDYRLQDVEISAPVEYQETSQLPPGMKKVKEAGGTGLKRQVIKVVQVDGNVEEQVVHEFQVNAPKKKVVIQNTKPVAGESFNLTNLKVNRMFTVEATAYTYTGNPTATGANPRKGLIAVDPKVIPLGSQVYVEGYGYAVAADTGGDILGEKVDVFFPTFKECINWGRRPVRLFVLK